MDAIALIMNGWLLGYSISTALFSYSHPGACAEGPNTSIRHIACFVAVQVSGPAVARLFQPCDAGAQGRRGGGGVQ